MKILIFVFSFLNFHLLAISQSDTTSRILTNEEGLKLIKSLKIDSTKILGEFGSKTCKCIDSISVTGINAKESSKRIADCIDKQVEALDLMLNMMNSLSSPGKKTEIVLNNVKGSDRYIQTYRLLERWLGDSCKELRSVAAANNELRDFSSSEDKAALKEYNAGIAFMDAEKYKEALPYFEKAVKLDPTFVFAWDNIGVCSRRTGDLPRALEAYQMSLSIDPKGNIPLQNIPIVYEYMKEYDKALDAYKLMEKKYPEDPEAYYGAGRIYMTYKNDLEKGLDQLCKSYNIYIKMNSPYRVDAEKLIGTIFRELKKQDKEEIFNRILKENGISVSK